MENKLVTQILFLYSQGYSVKRISKEVNAYYGRVTKILSTNGVIINSNHAKILEYHKMDIPVDKIAQMLSISKSTVERYLPAVRPVYKINRSKNAIRIARCREKKKNMQSEKTRNR